MIRREFFLKVAASSMTVLFGSSFLFPAKAAEIELFRPEPYDPSACSNGVQTSVSLDPRHQLVVPREDVLAGVEKTYHIQGSADHDHEVTLTADDFASLASGNEIQDKSTVTLLHRHTVHVKCA
jgi:hypothetical protein